MFIDHHLGCGAEQLLIFNDGPIDQLVQAGLDPAALMARGVLLVALDDAFWRGEPGGRPADFITRRILVHARGKALCRSDWVFICDEDEFLLAATPVQAALDLIPDGVDSVVLPMAEAVWGPGDDFARPFGSTWFRQPYENPTDWRHDRYRLYGPLAPLFKRGVVGHERSKQFVRTRASFDEVDTHRCYRGGKDVSVMAETLGGPIAAINMLHFDAIGYDRWVRKFESRVADPSINKRALRFRQRQASLIPRLVRLGRLPAMLLFRGLYGISRRQKRLLERRGLIFQSRTLESVTAPVQPAAASGRARMLS